MNREEALKILGLAPGASDVEIRTAYKECVQIYHPDRFATNQTLQERATEQFKTVQQAYEYLVSPSARSRADRRQASSETRGRHSRPERRESPAARDARAELGRISAESMQIVYERDMLKDKRRTGIILVVIGLVGAFLFTRMRNVIIGGVSAAVLLAGIVRAVQCQSSIHRLNVRLDELDIKKQELMDYLGENAQL